MGATLATAFRSGPQYGFDRYGNPRCETRPKPIKLGDERGLFLLLQLSGGKLWRLKYRYLGKEKKLSLGIYPDISLKAARARRNEARTLLANGADPASVKFDLEAEAKVAAANTSIARFFGTRLMGSIRVIVQLLSHCRSWFRSVR